MQLVRYTRLISNEIGMCQNILVKSLNISFVEVISVVHELLHAHIVKLTGQRDNNDVKRKHLQIDCGSVYKFYTTREKSS
jgi:hypothetical protein